MVDTILERELHVHLEQLPAIQQRRVLNFARELAAARAKGVHGSKLLAFAGTIAAEDLEVISQAVENNCETINPNGW